MSSTIPGTVEIKQIYVGESFDVSRVGYPSRPIPETWALVSISDLRVLRLTDEQVIILPAIGAPATYRWTFTGREPGTAIITLIHMPDQKRETIEVVVLER